MSASLPPRMMPKKTLNECNFSHAIFSANKVATLGGCGNKVYVELDPRLNVFANCWWVKVSTAALQRAGTPL